MIDTLDYFAGLAMVEYMKRTWNSSVCITDHDIAMASYKMATAMVQLREKYQSGEGTGTIAPPEARQE